MPIQINQKLDETAGELFDYIDELKIIKELFDALPVKQSIASPYLNFRDALFHYNKMYDAGKNKDQYSFVQQHACIEEHLNRGLKDFAIHLCNNYYIIIIHDMIKSKEKNGDKDIILKELRAIYHGIKNLIVDIRHTGQTLQHFDNNKNTWLKKLVDLIGEFQNLMIRTPALNQLYYQTSRGV